MSAQSPMVVMKQEPVTPAKEPPPAALSNTMMTDQLKNLLMNFNSEMMLQMAVPKEKVV